MKEGSVLLAALLLTGAIAYWSEQYRTPTVAHDLPPPAAPEPGVAPPRLPVPGPAARLPVFAGPDQAYRCTGGGSQTFSDLPCAAGERQEIIDLRTPPPGTPTASYAEQYRRLLASRPPVSSEAVSRSATPRSDAESDKEAECRALMYLIDQIDAHLRQPQGPAYIEMQKARRLSASDKRFSLGC